MNGKLRTTAAFPQITPGPIRTEPISINHKKKKDLMKLAEYIALPQDRLFYENLKNDANEKC